MNTGDARAQLLLVAGDTPDIRAAINDLIVAARREGYDEGYNKGSDHGFDEGYLVGSSNEMGMK